MSLSVHARHQRRRRGGARADDEESRRQPLAREKVEHLRRELRIGPVVECERDLARDDPGATHQIRRRRSAPPLVHDAAAVDAQRAPAARRCRGQAQERAVAFVGDAIVGRYGRQRRRRIAEMCERVPDAGILAAQSPQRDLVHAGGGGGARVVPHARAVGEPDLMRAFVIHVLDAHVAVAIPARLDARFACRRVRVDKRDRLGRILSDPIVSIDRQARGQLRRR